MKSAMQWFRCSAPRDPHTDTIRGRPSSCMARRALSRSAVRKSGRTGLPVMTRFAPSKNLLLSSKQSMTAPAFFARALVVTPGKALTSSSAVGTPSFWAAFTTGKEA